MKARERSAGTIRFCIPEALFGVLLVLPWLCSCLYVAPRSGSTAASRQVADLIFRTYTCKPIGEMFTNKILTRPHPPAARRADGLMPSQT